MNTATNSAFCSSLSSASRLPPSVSSVWSLPGAEAISAGRGADRAAAWAPATYCSQPCAFWCSSSISVSTSRIVSSYGGSHVACSSRCTIAAAFSPYIARRPSAARPQLLLRSHAVGTRHATQPPPRVERCYAAAVVIGERRRLLECAGDCAAGYGQQEHRTVRTAREQRSNSSSTGKKPGGKPDCSNRPDPKRLRATAVLGDDCCAALQATAALPELCGVLSARLVAVGLDVAETVGAQRREPPGQLQRCAPFAHDPRRSRWRRTCRAWRRACSWTLRPPRRARTAAWAAAARAPASTDPRARARGRVAGRRKFGNGRLLQR